MFFVLFFCEISIATDDLGNSIGKISLVNWMLLLVLVVLLVLLVVLVLLVLLVLVVLVLIMIRGLVGVEVEVEIRS